MGRGALALLVGACLAGCSETREEVAEEETPEWLEEAESTVAAAPHGGSNRFGIEPPPEGAEPAFVSVLGSMSGIRVVPDAHRAPRWPLDTARPFNVQLGRGGGREGLDVIEVDRTGRAQLTRWHRGLSAWTRREVVIDAAQWRDAMDQLGPTQLKARYREPFVMDGTQWAFEVRQGDHRHVVYCDNRAPDRLHAFARRLDELLEAAAIDEAPEARLGPGERGDAGLWDAVEALPDGKPLS